jgi:hypothetical protein
MDYYARSLLRYRSLPTANADRGGPARSRGGSR